MAFTNPEKYGFEKSYSGKQLDHMREQVIKRIFGKYDPRTDKDGSKKWQMFGDISNLDNTTLESHQMWKEELDRIGYTLSDIRQSQNVRDAVVADILTIKDKAITDEETCRKLLFSNNNSPNTPKVESSTPELKVKPVNDSTKEIIEPKIKGLPKKAISGQGKAAIGAIAIGLVAGGLISSSSKQNTKQKSKEQRRDSQIDNSYAIQMAQDISGYRYGKRMTGFVNF